MGSTGGHTPRYRVHSFMTITFIRTMWPSIWPQLTILLLLVSIEIVWAQRVFIAHPRQSDILYMNLKQNVMNHRGDVILVKVRAPAERARQQEAHLAPLRVNPNQLLANQRTLAVAQTFGELNATRNIQTVGQQELREQELSYAVVIDCGSSGTRVQIFYWPSAARSSSSSNQQHQQPLDQFAYSVETLRNATNGQPLSLRIRPGLASVRDNPEAASDYLAPMMRFASNLVPRVEQPRTPVYIMGTAGMRTLSPAQQASILADIEHDLSREFAFRPITAEVISGPDEGLYQWLSINALARRLGPGYGLAPGSRLPSVRSRRLGLVEMGGYSAQVAFEISARVDALVRKRLKHQPAAWRAYKSLSRALELSGGAGEPPSRIFTVSFLGFGSDSVRQWAVDLLVRDSLDYLRRIGLLATMRSHRQSPTGGVLTLNDPCLPRDSHESMVKPVSLLADGARTLNHNVQTPSEPTFQVRLLGRANFGACLALLTRLVTIARVEQTTCYSGGGGGGGDQEARNNSKVCEAPLIGTNFLPWHELQFIGLGELYYTSHEMLRASGRFNGALIKWATASICGKPLELINAQYPGEDNFTRRRNRLACFKATWLLVWLAAALRMPMDGMPPTHKWAAANFTTTSRVDGQEVDWKLGAVLAKTIGASTSLAAAANGFARPHLSS